MRYGANKGYLISCIFYLPILLYCTAIYFTMRLGKILFYIAKNSKGRYTEAG